MGTSHELGQNFAKAFDITYTSADGDLEHAWTTSWGSSTRMVGGLIMCHGDDNGLRLPPHLAPTQVQIMAVKAADGVVEAAHVLRDELQAAGFRVAVDDRVDVPFGRRAVDAELKGVPIRVEVGPRELADDAVIIVRRLDGTKSPVRLDAAEASIAAAVKSDQQALYDEALALRESRTEPVTNLPDALNAAERGWARVPWDAVGERGETKANQQGITVRCLQREDGSVPATDDEPGLVALLARAY
jgi:prolyl-tRNA synthetase